MRFIIREQAYETLRAAGKLRYVRDGQAIGLEEQWRVTAAAEGYHFLRVDMDGRRAAANSSCLYHLTLGPEGRPERLKLRFFGPGQEVSADYLLDEQSVTVVREVNGQHFEQLVEAPDGYVFWFQSALGLSLMARAGAYGGIQLPVTIAPDEAAGFALQSAPAELQWFLKEKMVVTQQHVEVRPCLIRWLGQQRRIWLDDSGWPVRLEIANGLEASETQYVRVAT
jgi:hypothetical protein